MNSESNRLATFYTYNWTGNVAAGELAKSGFHFVGPWDRVQCAFCFGKLEGWVLGDDPDYEHNKYYGKCCHFIQDKYNK